MGVTTTMGNEGKTFMHPPLEGILKVQLHLRPQTTKVQAQIPTLRHIQNRYCEETSHSHMMHRLGHDIEMCLEIPLTWRLLGQIATAKSLGMETEAIPSITLPSNKGTTLIEVPLMVPLAAREKPITILGTVAPPANQHRVTL